jgi:hypothetical protein
LSEDTSDLDEVFDFLSEERRNRRDPEEHPSPETLTAYQANELSQEEDERIQEHLAKCRHCTEMLLELEEFLRPAEVEPMADSKTLAEGRRRGEIGKPAGFQRPERGTEARILRSLRTFQTLAAVFGLLTIGLSWYLVRSQELSSILPPVPQKTLYFAQTRAAGQAEKPQDVHLPLALGFATAPGYPRYRLELLAKDGRLLYSAETALASATLRLDKDALPQGIYEVRLWGLKDGRAEPIGESQRLSVQP